MKKPLKNLLVSIGAGYHPAVRILHSMVKDKTDSRILVFQLERKSSANEDLRVDYSVMHKEFSKALDSFEKWIQQNQFELIGISFMSHHWDVFVELSNAIRRVLPACKIIAGGVHAWLISPLETLRHCDYVCAGEGEELYANLLDAISGSLDARPLRIPGLIEKDRGDIIHTPIKEYMPMDILPLPTVGSKAIYHLSAAGDDLTFANEDPYMNSSFGCVHIGRGCPFKCTYCINSICSEKRKVRMRSVDKVIDELEALLEFKRFKAFIFMDEIFPLQSEWLKEFSEAYRQRINIPFNITLYPGMLNYEKAKLLKEAGLKEVSIGIQSGSENIRRNIYKRAGANSKITEENKILSGLGIMVYYDFIIKNPFESEKDYEKSLELISGLNRPFYLKFYTLAYYPKHPITETALEKKLISQKNVSATLGYLDVTTPHKVVIADHYLVEDRLFTWNSRLMKDARGGSAEAIYLLLISCYGYWFIPKFIAEFMKSQLKKRNKNIIIAFISFIQAVLIIRNNFLNKNLHLALSTYKERGLRFTIRKIINRIAHRRF